MRSRRRSTITRDRDAEHSQAREPIYLDEISHPLWFSRERIFECLHSIPEDSVWNTFICILALGGIVLVMVDVEENHIDVADLCYNVLYALNVLILAYNDFVTIENVDITTWTLLGYVIDFGSFFHYVLIIKEQKILKFVCYYLRLHRPLNFLWQLNGYNLNGSVLGATLKYIYIFIVMRVTWACVWIQISELQVDHDFLNRSVYEKPHYNESKAKFFAAFYYINQMFLPIGPSTPPANDIERLVSLLIMMSGAVLVMAAAVASLSLVISVYMRPEEAFRARYSLIMQEVRETNVPASLRQKVNTFYKMYWHKQRAVSEARLLHKFPPILPALVNTEIYFEAIQKSRIMCDLTFEFLTELAKYMTTISYIPGDTIIKRDSTKSSMIFIAYGDVEMLTAEDDSTAILRMCRGTVLSPCAGGVAVACARSHVMIRAASFCIAHVLDVADLWRVARKYGKTTRQSEALLCAFHVHLENVKKHYSLKFPVNEKHKSSILHFKHSLKVLKKVRDSQGRLVLDNPEIFLEVARSYVMRNRQDSSIDESDAICLRSTFPYILQPESSLQMVWQIVVSCSTAVASVMIPYNLAFVASTSTKNRSFYSVVDVINIIDVIVHLSTGAHVEEGVPINFTQTASQQMLSMWFFLDVAAVLPIFYFIGDGYFDGINKLLKLPKLIRSLKALEELLAYKGNRLRIVSFTLLVLIACYLIACSEQGFMCLQYGYCVVTNFTHVPYWNKSPLDVNDTETSMTYALYWATSTFKFTKHIQMFDLDHLDEAVYTLLLLEICIVMHIFITAVYSASIMVTTSLRDDYDSTILNVKNFMIRNELDPQMRKRFTNYLELCWYTDKAYSMTNKRKSIFHDLPPHVYQEIISRKRSKYILNIPFMKFVPKAELKSISSTARLYYTSPNEILMNTGDISNEMFVIKQGMCEVINPDTKEVVAVLSAKGYFGALELLLRLPAFYTVRAVTHVQVFSISKKRLGKLFSIPQVKFAIKYARSLPEYRNLKVRRESFLNFEPPVRPPNRAKFRLPKKYEPDTDFLRPFNKLGFLAVLRYVFPRFTIRPDGRYMHLYELFRGFCVLLVAMISPSYSYLRLQWPFLRRIMSVLDVMAYFDIVQRMLVAYYNDKGILVYHPAATSAYYLRGSFAVDLFSCLPLEFLEQARQIYDYEYNMHRVNPVRSALRLNRLMQMYRLPSAINSLTSHIERRDIHLVIRAIPVFVTLLNVLTTYVVFNSANIYTNRHIWRIVPLKDKGGSWLVLFEDVFRFNITETPFKLHLACYFWIVYEGTTTGYSCFHPSNFDLMKFICFGMIISTMVLTYFSVCIISIRANVNKELAGFQEHLKDIIYYMYRENLKKDLQKEVLNYYEYNWDKTGGVDYYKVLKLCHQITLRTDAILHIYGPTFARCPFLSKCDISLLRIMGREVKSIYLLRNMRIIDVDDVISDLYFVVYGHVQVRTREEDDDPDEGERLHKGSVFGNLDPSTMVRSQSTFMTLSRVHLLQINTHIFHRILADFPKVQRLMKASRGDNENYILGRAISRSSRTQSMQSESKVFFTSRKNIIKHLYFNDTYIQMYLIFVSLACIYLDVYNVGFQNNTTPFITALYILDCAFFFKILLHFMLPYIVDMEYMMKALLPLRKGYFRGDFKYDLLSILPTELFCLLDDEKRWMIFPWLRLNRLLRIVTVYKSLHRQQRRLNINLTSTTLFNALVWFSLFIHFSACLWYFIAVLQDNSVPRSSWIYNDHNVSWCENTYICSLYFVLSSFTHNGVGDILPKNELEVIFVSVFQIVSVMVFMVYVGEFSNIIHYQSFRNFGYYCKFLELQYFLANNRVSKNLVNTVNRYALHLWREARGMQIPHFLSTAPPAIKLKVMSAVYMKHFTNHFLFEGCEPAFLRQLMGKITMYYYNRDMFIVKEGEITDCIYIVHTGQVVETSSDSATAKTIIVGGSFGLVEGLFPNTPFTNTYKSLLKCQILLLSFRDWSYLLNHFPNSADAIYYKFNGRSRRSFFLQSSNDDSQQDLFDQTDIQSSTTSFNVELPEEKKVTKPILSSLHRRNYLSPSSLMNVHDLSSHVDMKEQSDTSEAELGTTTLNETSSTGQNIDKSQLGKQPSHADISLEEQDSTTELPTADSQDTKPIALRRKSILVSPLLRKDSEETEPGPSKLGNLKTAKSKVLIKSDDDVSMSTEDKDTLHLQKEESSTKEWKNIETLKPSNTESSNVETTNFIPSNVDPSNSDPSNMEPSNVELSNTEPTNIEPSDIEPFNIEPSNTEPSSIEPSNVESTNVETSKMEPSILKTAAKELKNIETLEPSNVEPSNFKTINFETSDVEPSNVEASNVEPSNIQATNVEPSNVEPYKFEPSKAESSTVDPSIHKLSKVEPTDDIVLDEKVAPPPTWIETDYVADEEVEEHLVTAPPKPSPQPIVKSTSKAPSITNFNDGEGAESEYINKPTTSARMNRRLIRFHENDNEENRGDDSPSAPAGSTNVSVDEAHETTTVSSKDEKSKRKEKKKREKKNK